jgi:hypothetical protein
MQSATLFRLSGAAAVAGGMLRIANTFTLHMFDPHSLALIYLATDVFLLLGLIGWYASRADSLGASGAVGFVIAVVGILVIRSTDLFPASGYRIGATALLAGLVVASIPILLRRGGPVLAPVLWLLSFVCGLASMVIAPLATLSAVLFGAGFICAGFGLLRS